MDNHPETDRWTSLYGARRRVIACATVIEEMLPLLPADVSHEVLDFGLHLRPEKLRKVLQAKIDEASQSADVLLLGYGLCSMAVVGLQARTPIWSSRVWMIVLRFSWGRVPHTRSRRKRNRAPIT